VKRKPTSFGEAVVVARSASIDEARRFTDWSRAKRSLTRTPVSDPEASLASVAGEDLERASDELERLERAIDLARLDDRSLTILTRVAEGFTLEEVGLELGVSASRVSQLRSEALRKIRRDAN
jgi:RNA polymerase sigma factor (sigma-70 family)